MRYIFDDFRISPATTIEEHFLITLGPHAISYIEDTMNFSARHYNFLFELTSSSKTLFTIYELNYFSFRSFRVFTLLTHFLSGASLYAFFIYFDFLWLSSRFYLSLVDYIFIFDFSEPFGLASIYLLGCLMILHGFRLGYWLSTSAFLHLEDSVLPLFIFIYTWALFYISLFRLIYIHDFRRMFIYYIWFILIFHRFASFLFHYFLSLFIFSFFSRQTILLL